MELAGTLPALITPMKDGGVDEDALRALVNKQIEGGVSGLVPCGTTGESVTLSGAEYDLVVGAVVAETKGRVPVIAGAGTVSTSHSIELAKKAKAQGADGLLLVCPYYNKPTQAGLEAHFRAILDGCSMPTMLYNIPGRTGVDLQVETLLRLLDRSEIVAIKEATGNVLRAQEILTRAGDRIAVFSGDDALTLAMMSLGAQGVVSVTCNAFPSQVSEVTTLAAEGKWLEARRAHLRLAPVHQSMFVESNPGPIKFIASELGLCQPEIRLPMVWPSKVTQDTLRGTLQQAGLLS